MVKTVLKAEERKVTGRKVKKLRREGILPVNVYGKSVKSASLQVDLSEFVKTYKEAGETNLVELTVGGKVRPVLIHEIQTDPITEEYIHADFLQVNLKEKVKAQVPVELVGLSPAEKEGLGTLVQQIHEVEVEALPADLPDKFEVDVSVLVDLETIITVADLKVDAKVEVLEDKKQIIAKIEAMREEEEEPVVVAEETPADEVAGEQAEGEEAGDVKEDGGEEKKD